MKMCKCDNITASKWNDAKIYPRSLTHSLAVCVCAWMYVQGTGELYDIRKMQQPMESAIWFANSALENAEVELEIIQREKWYGMHIIRRQNSKNGCQ